MRFNLSTVTLITLTSLTYTHVNADTIYDTTSVVYDTPYDARSVITDEQLNAVIKDMLKIAPSGTKTTNVTLQGNFLLNDDRYMTAINLTSIKFKVTTKFLGIPVSSDVTMALGGTFPTLDCNNIQITTANATGTSSVPLFDSSIRDYIVKNADSILRDGFVAQTDLAKYCKIKPKSQQINSDNESAFEF